MDIEKLVKRYKTRNPFEIIEAKRIVMIFEPLGTVNGYYHTAYKRREIHVNSDLPEYLQLFTAAHELGHAILHPKANTPFLKNNTFFSVNKLEIEANKFAVDLIISNEDLKEYRHFTIGQLSTLYGLPENLIELRFKK